MFKFSKHYEDYVKSFREIGIAPFRKTKPIRKKMGDDIHLLVFQDIFFSILSLSPKTYASYIYSWGKFLALESTKNALDVLEIGVLTKMTSKIFAMKLLKNEIYANGLKKTWVYYKIGIPEFEFVDEAAKTFRIRIEELEESWGLPKIGKKVCFFPAGFLAGNIEGMLGKSINTFETRCIADGHKDCEFAGAMDLPIHKFDVLEKDEFRKIKKSIFDRMFSEKKKRPKLSDYVHLAIPQIFYLGLSLSSPGAHSLLYWVGRESGKEIARRVKGAKLGPSLKELQSIFKKLKLGILKTKKGKLNFVVEDSAFSSGTMNFEKRICSYTAGLLAGFIEEKIDKKINVVENKCIANGDKNCEFTVL